MKDKKSLKVMILAALAAVVTLVCSSCSNNQKEYTFTGNKRIFGVKEHMISIPLDKDIRLDRVRLEYHPGYEAAGIATSHYGYAAALYQNIVPVECYETQDGYVEFGTPIEEEVTLKLTQEE